MGDKDKQVATGPFGMYLANPLTAPELISISLNDMKTLFEEWATERGMVFPPPPPYHEERTFPPREEHAQPQPRQRGKEREHRAPLEEVNSRAISQPEEEEEELRRIDEISELSHQVDRLGCIIEDLRQPIMEPPPENVVP
ncbi:hypothetical protein Salat_1475100 [Sesamum alatum]|uniref:Uncharacterized protein n=1 Tax=Sesamum alatum TaxID=300844 RepID=A0AAE1YBR0_9LAMI|nr:hypothetical protein Salat_1475100 [Sesamum alatum]